MLTKEAFDEALPLTQSFDARNIVLEPIEGTPLAELVKQTFILPDESGKQVDIAISVETTNVSEMGVGGSSHDLIMDEIVKVGAESVRKHISFAKNVVAPIVGEYIDLVEEDIVQLPVSGLNKFEIKQYVLPEPFAAMGFRESLALFKNTPNEDYKFNLRLPDVDSETLTQLVMTGSSSIDDHVNAFVNRVGVDFLAGVYSRVFQARQNTDSDYSKVYTLRSLMDDKENGEDFTLAVYLMANKLYDGPPENTENSYDDYNQSILKLRNQTGNKLYRLDHEVESAYEKDRVVKAILSDHQVLVYPAVYEDWITGGGGDNDILLGSLIADESYYTLDRLNEDASKLKALWENFKRIEERTAINNKFNYVKESLSRRFSEILVKCNEVNNVNKDSCIKIFKEELALITANEITDICNVALKLITRAMFYNTDAERILTSIEKNSKENPSITPREAALIATIELITDWVSSQMKPVSAYTDLE